MSAVLVLIVGCSGINPGRNEGNIARIHFTGWWHLGVGAIGTVYEVAVVGVFFQFGVRNHWCRLLFAAGGVAADAVGVNDGFYVRNIADQSGVAVARAVQVLLVIVVTGCLRKACNAQNG